MSAFSNDVAARFGVLPNFFCSASAAPGLIEELWAFARAAYLDAPLPSLFKERLFVHLSRFCEVRYCVVRHVGFLIGQGRPAGDPAAEPETVEQVVALLSRPLPDAAALDAALSRLEARREPADIPAPRTQAEADLFDVLTVMFVEPRRSARARDAVRRAVGAARFEIMTAYLAFIHTAHFWTETHPELDYEPDMLAVIERFGDLARLLLDPTEAKRVRAGEQLRRALDELHRTRDSLRESEERHRAALESLGEVLYALDADTRIRFASRPALTLWDRREDEVVGRRFLDAFPEAAGSAPWEAQRTAMMQGREAHLCVLSPVLGRWIEMDAYPTTGGGVTVAFRDVEDRRRDHIARARSEAARREGERRLQTLVEGIPQLVWRATDSGEWTWASPQWAAYTGQPEQESHGHGWLGAVHRDDREACLSAWGEAVARGAFRADHRLCHPNEGRHRWVQSQALPVRDEEGRVVEWLGTTTDVEDLRRIHEERILIAELQHRTRNLLTVVSGIAEQTLAASASLDEFGAHFDQRLAALGRVQGLLSRGAEPNVTADELVRLELAAHGVDPNDAGRVRLDGPPVVLPARVVQLLALTLHELMTNAIKHGALGREQGRLDIVWRERRAPGERARLRLDWAESGVSLGVDVSAVRRGFGLDLIEFALPYELDGETRLTLTPEGVRCTIDLPVDDATAALGVAGQ